MRALNPWPQGELYSYRRRQENLRLQANIQRIRHQDNQEYSYQMREARSMEKITQNRVKWGKQVRYHLQKELRLSNLEMNRNLQKIRMGELWSSKNLYCVPKKKSHQTIKLPKLTMNKNISSTLFDVPQQF